MAKRAIDLSDEKDCELVPLPVLLVSTESSLESSLGSPAKSLAMSLEKECELVILPVLLPSIVLKIQQIKVMGGLQFKQNPRLLVSSKFFISSLSLESKTGLSRVSKNFS